MKNEQKLDYFLNKVVVGDCIESMKKIPDVSVDLVFADPPYFMQTDGVLRRTDGSEFKGVDDAWDKFADYAEYDAFSNAWLKECRRILKPSGAIWVIGAFQNIYRLGYIMQNIGFWILNDVIWSKRNAAPNFRGTRLQNAHETLLWCSKSKNSRYTFNYQTMKHLNGGRQDKSVWDIGICIGAERLKNENGEKVHNTQKPEQLLYKVVMASTKPGDIILDPFFGTGTTGAVAKRLGRNFIGLEMSREYTKAALERIKRIKPSQNEIETKLTLEVKPPRVSVKQLIESGYLKSGEKLFDKAGNAKAKLTDAGYADDSTETLSIHKMAAKILRKANQNGWDYWYVNRDGKMKFINDFRYEYAEKNK
ncbi:MAG: site-specific DNA-methyltransferase [Candidatus Nomurabacteria bacterium]|jgi:site-specific DNA-methyltransferase (adenine-specific)|nr:site-specific DNA-methyltransferase [Candidatus Nomurabacteria bacterium]